MSRLYINDPAGHEPHGPRYDLNAEPPPDIDGLFQPRNVEERQQIAEKLSAAVEQGKVADLSIDDYQRWAEQDWKAAHGTKSSVARFAAKLREELIELQEELSAGNVERNNVISELGDVIWSATALASDIQESIKWALMRRFVEYGQGTRYDDRTVPPWVERSQQMAFKPADFNFAAIDKVAGDDYVPQASAWMNIDPPEDYMLQADIAGALTLLELQTYEFAASAERLYEADLHIGGRAKGADRNVAEIYLIVAYLAQKVAGSSLSEVVTHNIKKVSRRVDRGLVDKTDGERPEELK